VGRLNDDLLTGDTELVETHISWVFLRGDEVFKIKKPVDFGFLDQTTLERRKRACEAELVLNRRLAPDVYLDVVPVRRGLDGVHRLEGDGEIVDYAVHMRRLSDSDRADLRLRAGSLGDADVDRLAAAIARFHEEARRDDEVARYGTVEVIAANVAENFAQTEHTIGAFLTAAELAAVRDYQEGMLHDQRARFERRISGGRIVEGHGDLRLEHVYLDGPAHDRKLRVIDCIEFNERFRHGDVAADVAFLAMDLASQGRADLAERFLASYAREANDYDLYPLADFYESYRAFVRGKVASFVVADPGASAAARERAQREGRRYFALSVAATQKPLIAPVVVAIGGIIASGKSTLAEALRDAVSAPVVDSDRTRKSLLNVAPTDRVYHGAWSDAYEPGFTDRVYEEVLRRAEAVLISNRSVIVDASFRTRAMRSSVRALARRHGVPFVMIECRVPHDVARDRLRARAGDRTAVSDGRLEIFDDFVARWEAIDELDEGEHVIADTTRPHHELLADLRALLPAWPEGLRA
jgi:uncharacterized protein